MHCALLKFSWRKLRFNTQKNFIAKVALRFYNHKISIAKVALHFNAQKNQMRLLRCVSLVLKNLAVRFSPFKKNAHFWTNISAAKKQYVLGKDKKSMKQ